MNPNSSKQPAEYQDKTYQNPYYYPPNYHNFVINNQHYNQYLNYNYPAYYPPAPPNMKYLSQQFNQMGLEQNQAPGYYPSPAGMGMGYNYGQQGMAKQSYGSMNEPFRKEYESNEGHQFETDFPRALDYSDEEQIAKALPHYKEINSSAFDPDKIAHAHFFILRSTNDDDIHKAIKYKRWTSSAKNNETLSRIWRENNGKNVNVPIYLFFSVVKSQQFLGVAEMVSDFDPKNSFKYWWEGCKWFGTFEVKWIYIKDIKDKQFDHIRDNQNPITNFPDGTKITDKSGKQMMNIFKNNPSKPNIFGAFSYMDCREDNLRKNRDNDPMFLQSFNQLAEQFGNNPSSLLRSKGYPKYKKPGYYNKGPGGNQGYSQGGFSGEERYNTSGSNEGFYKKQQQSNQELHEVMFVTTGGSKQNKEKKKMKKKKVLKGDSEEYNVTGAVKVEIVESSDEEEKIEEKPTQEGGEEKKKQEEGKSE